MATTAVDICNMALSLLGDEATVSSLEPPEGSAQADHCARFYGIAVNDILSEHAWSFALKRVELPQLADEPVGEPGGKAYSVPADCVRVTLCRGRIAGNYRMLRGYSMENMNGERGIVTKASDVWIRYVSSQVDPSAFSPPFISALVHRVASLLAGALVPGSSGMSMAQEQIKLYEHYLARARNQDARQQAGKEKYRPKFVGDAVVEDRDAIY